MRGVLCVCVRVCEKDVCMRGVCMRCRCVCVCVCVCVSVCMCGSLVTSFATRILIGGNVCLIVFTFDHSITRRK